MTSDCCLPAPPNSLRYAPDEIIIYGTKLNRLDFAAVELPQLQQALDKNTYSVRLSLWQDDGNIDTIVPRDNYVVVAAYGYAYEGHCYRFDKAKILLFFTPQGRTDEPAQGCGFDPPTKSASQYRMWRIRSKTMILELTVTSDFAETAILEANLPGRRSPNTYSSNQQMAHRGGRLTDTSTRY